jgi:branched-chain amino acid transport system substrate-binding protein
MPAWLPSPDLNERWFGDAAQFAAAAARPSFVMTPIIMPRPASPTWKRWLRAMKMAGSIDLEKVRDALSRVKCETLYGPVAFNANG